jgi:hypothetical protein
MKNTLLLVTIATSFLLPAVIHADPPASKTKRTNKAAADTKAVVTKPAAAKPQETDYITKTTATGSHIPTVWRAYNGRVDSPSNLRVYGENDLNRAGQLDVATELSMVDPSISNTRGR